MNAKADDPTVAEIAAAAAAAAARGGWTEGVLRNHEAKMIYDEYFMKQE
jgi:hypothetical protein